MLVQQRHDFWSSSSSILIIRDAVIAVRTDKQANGRTLHVNEVWLRRARPAIVVTNSYAVGKREKGNQRKQF